MKKEVYLVISISLMISSFWFFNQPIGWILAILGIIIYLIYVGKITCETRVKPEKNLECDKMEPQQERCSFCGNKINLFHEGNTLKGVCSSCERVYGGVKNG